MAQQQPYDLTRRLLPNLDRHLGLPLLNFLDERSIYPPDQLLAAKFELLKPTNMVTYIAELDMELHPEKRDSESVKEQYAQREQAILKQLQQLQERATSVMDTITSSEVVAALKQDKEQNLQFLKEQHGLTLEEITTLYHMGRFQYSIGQYASGADYLYHFRVLTTDVDLESSAMWGKLVCDVLEGAWDQALAELEQLRKHIDNHYPWEMRNSVIGLQQRTWWLHWSLFVFFNHPEGRDKLVDEWMSQQSVGGGIGSRGEQPTFVFAFLPSLQANCPWLLRYLVAAIVLSRRAAFKGSVYIGANARISSREHLGAALVTAVRQERYQYSDPVVDFIRKLYLDLDFDGAAEILKEAEKVCADDFFLADFAADFGERARWLYSEAYCRVHHRIDVADLSEQLGLGADEGERWIVNLIRDARLDAKIDFKENIVHMNRSTVSAHQAVIDKTKSLLERSSRVSQALESNVPEQTRLGRRTQAGQPKAAPSSAAASALKADGNAAPAATTAKAPVAPWANAQQPSAPPPTTLTAAVTG